MAKKEPTSNSPHWISDLFKNKFVKIPIIIIACTLAAFCVFLFGKAIFGYPVKVFGIEVNIPEKKTDTVYVENKESKAALTPIKNDTTKKLTIRPNSISVKQGAISKDTGKVNSKYNIQNPTFNAPTQIGDNNVQNINAEIELKQDILNQLVNGIARLQIKNKLSLDTIFMYLPQGGNVAVYKQIRDHLRKNNYKIEEGQSMTSRIVESIDLSAQQNILTITVGDIKPPPDLKIFYSPNLKF